MTLNDVQVFGSMLESVEIISSILPKYTQLESTILSRPIMLRSSLAEALMKLYRAILRYIPKAHHYYSRSTLSKQYLSANIKL
jgi:hypothetical protein